MHKPYYDLHHAASRNNVSAMKQLVKNGRRLDHKDRSGCTALHYAAGYNATDATRWLIEKGAYVNSVAGYPDTPDGRTPLHFAAQNNATDAGRLLVDNGADVDTKSDGARTPLYFAVQNNAAGIVRLLIKNGVDFNKRTSIVPPGPGILKDTFIKAFSIETNPDTNYTLLHMAARYSASDVVIVLIENGMNIEARVSNYRVMHPRYSRPIDEDMDYSITPLHIAVCFFAEEAVRALINNGADVDAQYKVRPNHGHGLYRACTANELCDAVYFDHYDRYYGDGLQDFCKIRDRIHESLKSERNNGCQNDG